MISSVDSVRRIVVVGDAYVSVDDLTRAAVSLGFSDAEIIPLLWGDGDKNHFADEVTLIERGGPDAVSCPEGLAAALEEAEVLMVHFCPVPRAVLEGAKKLKLVGTCRGGVENLATDVLTQRGIPLVTIIRNAQAVAEFTLGLMLTETRNIARSHRDIMAGRWPTDFPNSEHTSTLCNLTVGLVGLGNIGALVAQKLAALNIPVIGYDAYMSPEAMATLPIRPVDSMEAVFREADVVSLHLRLTEENRGLVNRRLISMMKPTAYLINASRGGLIHEGDLCDTLRKHGIAGAALDVFTDEPLPASHPLLALDNVTLTPHIAGDTVDAIARSPYLLAEKLQHYLAGDFRQVWNKSVLT